MTGLLHLALFTQAQPLEAWWTLCFREVSAGHQAKSWLHVLWIFAIQACSKGHRSWAWFFIWCQAISTNFKKNVLHPETFVSCLHRKNGCFDRSHLVCGTARPQGWGTASLLGLISFYSSANTESPSLFVFWPWLSDCQNQENKIWQADGCTEKITTKCDKAVTHPVAWGPDNASPRLRAVHPTLAAPAHGLMSGTT